MSKLWLLKKQLTFGCFDNGCSYCVEQCLVFHEGPQAALVIIHLEVHCIFLDKA